MMRTFKSKSFGCAPHSGQDFGLRLRSQARLCGPHPIAQWKCVALQRFSKGTVRSSMEKQTAERGAWSALGIAAVENQIAVEVQTAGAPTADFNQSSNC